MIKTLPALLRHLIFALKKRMDRIEISFDGNTYSLIDDIVLIMVNDVIVAVYELILLNSPMQFICQLL